MIYLFLIVTLLLSLMICTLLLWNESLTRVSSGINLWFWQNIVPANITDISFGKVSHESRCGEVFMNDNTWNVIFEERYQ